MDPLGTSSDILRLAGLADYNTRVVLFGAAMLGLVSGVIGVFMMLRRKALISDVVSHASLPGIVAAFMITAGSTGGGKQLPWLLVGALASGCLGMAVVHAIKSKSHIKEDAALGIVLSSFFGLGVVLMGFAQRMRQGSAAGLETFIYGKTASMLAFDAWLMAGAAVLTGIITAILFKEFRLVCFDPGFARSLGWPVRTLDALLTLLVVIVTVVGLQAVGLILMIALLITPPASARFWTDRLGSLVMISAAMGSLGAITGAAGSALYPDLPAGAMIVLVCSLVFLVSLVFGARRGLLPRWYHQRRLSHRMERHHLLRLIYEQLEPQLAGGQGAMPALLNASILLTSRRWNPMQLQRVLRDAASDGEVEIDAWPVIRITEKGLAHARQVVRNHRLWEWYLIQHAEVDSSHVDRDADEIEHVLGVAMVQELERTLAGEWAGSALPDSPHPIAPLEGTRREGDR